MHYFFFGVCLFDVRLCVCVKGTSNVIDMVCETRVRNESDFRPITHTDYCFFRFLLLRFLISRFFFATACLFIYFVAIFLCVRIQVWSVGWLFVCFSMITIGVIACVH